MEDCPGKVRLRTSKGIVLKVSKKNRRAWFRELIPKFWIRICFAESGWSCLNRIGTAARSFEVWTQFVQVEITEMQFRPHEIRKKMDWISKFFKLQNFLKQNSIDWFVGFSSDLKYRRNCFANAAYWSPRWEVPTGNLRSSFYSKHTAFTRFSSELHKLELKIEVLKSRNQKFTRFFWQNHFGKVCKQGSSRKKFFSLRTCVTV